MFNILNGDIHITKKDDAVFGVALKRSTPGGVEPYELGEDDKVKFTVKQDFDSAAIIEKELTNGSGFTAGDTCVKFDIASNDTGTMNGTYYYDVQVRKMTDGGYCTYTVVPPHKFIVEKEVTS